MNPQMHTDERGWPTQIKNDWRQDAWFHASWRVPEDWECTCYGCDPGSGKIAYENRHGLQATLFWRRCKQVPDQRAILIGIHGKNHPRPKPAKNQQHIANDVHFHDEQLGEHLLLWGQTEQIALASCFLEKPPTLLQWVFPDARLKRLHTARDILRSMQLKNKADWQDWSLLGIRCRLPAGFVPDDVRALPGDVHIRFVGPKKMNIAIRRLGLASLQLRNHTLLSFFGGMFNGQRYRVVGKEERQIKGHSGLRLELHKRGEHAMEKLSGRWWRGHADCWHDQAHERLYVLEQIGPKRGQRLELTDVLP